MLYLKSLFQRSCASIAASVLLATLASTSGHAQVIPLGQVPLGRMELHTFQSVTLSDQEFLSGQKNGKAVIVPGELRIPAVPRAGPQGRLPAVVLLHGSGGIQRYVDDWAQWFNSIRVAAFVVDSFTSRGIATTSGDQSQLGRLAMIVDAYRALEVVSKHSQIDPERIVLMGFSRGAIAALYGSMTRFQRMHGPTTGVNYAAYIPFYASCNISFIEEVDVVDKPIRMFHGSADDFTPVAPCRAYVERLRKAGKDVQLTEYPDTHHVFDYRNPFPNKPLSNPEAQVIRRCQLEEVAGGRIINKQTKRTFDYKDPCVERGTTVAFNPQARDEAEKAVRAFVATVLKLR